MSTYSRPQVPAGSCGAISLRQAGRDLLKPISKMDQAFYFLQPVDVVALRIPDYPTIVREPMDLGTIEKKLDASSYATTEEFVADVKLVWYNARLYNPVGSVVHEAARVLEKAFDDRLEALVGSCDRPAPPAPDSDAADGVPASKLRPLLRSLQSHARSKPFRVPVDYVALNLPHYPTIITQPMDLATVSSNLERGRYGTVADLRRDIDLIWQNAIDFNGPTSWIGADASTLREHTKRKFSQSGFAGTAAIARALPERHLAVEAAEHDEALLALRGGSPAEEAGPAAESRREERRRPAGQRLLLPPVVEQSQVVDHGAALAVVEQLRDDGAHADRPERALAVPVQHARHGCALVLVGQHCKEAVGRLPVRGRDVARHLQPPQLRRQLHLSPSQTEPRCSRG